MHCNDTNQRVPLFLTESLCSFTNGESFELSKYKSKTLKKNNLKETKQKNIIAPKERRNKSKKNRDACTLFVLVVYYWTKKSLYEKSGLERRSKGLLPSVSFSIVIWPSLISVSSSKFSTFFFKISFSDSKSMFLFLHSFTSFHISSLSDNTFGNVTFMLAKSLAASWRLFSSRFEFSSFFTICSFRSFNWWLFTERLSNTFWISRCRTSLPRTPAATSACSCSISSSLEYSFSLNKLVTRLSALSSALKNFSTDWLFGSLGLAAFDATSLAFSSNKLVTVCKLLFRLSVPRRIPWTLISDSIRNCSFNPLLIDCESGE
uniref:Uncharacterized protein n=1 Tax=Noccaea caerulescens TaxID=107243 RepID=A0A1J3FNA2_NOCCA